MRVLPLITLALIAAQPVSAASPPAQVSMDSEYVVHSVTPAYPYEARSHHIEGRGSFIMHVRPDGTVSRVEVVRSTGHNILDREVIKALRQWQFKTGVFTVVATPIAFTVPAPKKKT